MANKRVTQLSECTGLADTDVFMIDCTEKGTRRVCANKIKEYVTDGIKTEMTDEDSLSALIETDMLPAVHDADGKILTDEAGKIILRY